VKPVREEIARTLDALLERDQVTELRALGGALKRPLLGYFNDREALIKAALVLDGHTPEGIYITANPVNPLLLARANNRLVDGKSGHGTTDGDIVHRRLMLIDLDPVRPSGISSSEEEHELAFERAKEVQVFLSDRGFPEPILADSGNGAHVDYLIDLLRDDGDLINNVLNVLDAIFSDVRVKVDTSVFNPARIIKLYGTVARKGDSLPERPHRLSRIVSLPSEVIAVPPALLENLRSLKPKPQPAPNSHLGNGRFDLRTFLSGCGLNVRKEKPYQGGTLYELEHCPFGDHRKQGKSCAIEFSDGKLGFNCFSDEHAHLGWRDLRAKVEPRHPTDQPIANGNLSGTPNHHVSSLITRTWPEPPDDAAYWGLAGEFVRLVEPHSEADPVAMLVQFLVAFGNVVGRTPYIEVGATRHYPNLFCVIVGNTSKARKGTSSDEVRRIFDKIDALWARNRIVSGLSSGEGLIWQVRDPIMKRSPVKKGGRIVDFEEYEEDPGEADKRLLVFQPEFANTLTVCTREGNTLSAIIREAWDRGDLRTLVKNSPARATGAHISVVAHITSEELLRHLDGTEAANGFANRFQWFAVRRSKALPFGGAVPESELAAFADKVRRAAEAARQVGTLAFTPDAREIWSAVYERLSEGRPGLLGAILGRSEAQVLRLAMVYALTGGQASIDVQHLQAALALWERAEASCEFVFGDRLGDPDADAILNALRATPTGLTRTEISNLFGRNQSAARIERALMTLLHGGLATVQSETTGGRSAQRFTATRVYEKNEFNERSIG
jgi:hypothetical protein